MKKILITIITSLSLISCSNWLDVFPNSEITGDKVFSNPNGFYSALAGLYNKMSDDKLYGFDMTAGYFDQMGGSLWTGAQNFVTFYANHSAYYKNVLSVQLMALNHTRGGVRYDYTDNVYMSMWTGLYNTITNANTLIKELEECDKEMFEPGVWELLMGETLAVRAYIHLDLVRIFQLPYLCKEGKTDARIPLMTTLDFTKFIPSSTTDVILDQVDADLAKSAELMKKVDPISSDAIYYAPMFSATSRQYKLNFYAVKLLQARSFHYRGMDKLAYDAAKEVIENAGAKYHFITDAEASILDSEGTAINRSFPMENLFAVLTEELDENMQDAIKSTGKRYGYFGRINSNPWLSTVDYPAPKPDGFFSSENDIRLKLWTRRVYPSGMVGKFIRESTDDADIALYPREAMPLLKLGEAYLIAAEAAINTTSATEALKLLNDLQTARKGGLSTSLDKDVLLEDLRLEARREFLGEGQLFFFYKRRNAEKLETLFQVPSGDYYFTMTPAMYTPDIPDAEFNGGRTY